MKVELVISMITIILFFLMTRNYRRYAPKEIKRRQEFKQQAKIVVPGKTRSPLCGVRQNRAGWSGVRVPVLFQMRGQL